MPLLGIDVGTSGTRALIVDDTGKLVASASADHAPFRSPHTGWAEQDPADWWQACQAAVARALAQAGGAAGAIRAIGLSGQMHGAVLLDGAGAVLRPAIIWCDQRTDDECRWLETTVGRNALLDLTSNPALTNFTLTKLLWVRAHEPELWARVRHVLLPKDYVRYRLSGEHAIDVADASGTLMLDVARRRWSEKMLEHAGLDVAMLPRVFESSDVCARVSRDGAAAIGVPAGTPIVAGAGDQAAGAVGMGITRPGAVSATIGTSGVVFAATNRPATDPKGRLHTFCHAVPDRWHVMGVTQAAGLSLRWLRDLVASAGPVSYDDLTTEAARVPPGADGVLWAPYLMGERTPHCDPTIRAALVGLAANHGRGHVVRAVLEGVAFSLRDTFEIFSELTLPVERVVLGGGGARSALWRQIQADVYGRAVETVAGDEGAAYGAAILAGVGAGVWPSVDDACDAAVRRAGVTQPQPDASAVMNERYAEFRRIYPALRAIEARAERSEQAVSSLQSAGLPATADWQLTTDDCLMSDPYTPRPQDKFSFGLWTVGNRGRDPFGDAVRDAIAPVDLVAMLAEVGAWGVNLHDNDLVPIDATPADRDRIVKDFVRACERHHIVVPMATVNLFYDPVFRDGAFTANDPQVRAYALQKTLRAMDLGAELGAKTFVLWGGREGTETDACRRPDEAVKRLREAVNYLCEYSIDRQYGFRFALEAKPNEPRGDIYMATTGAYLGFITTLDHPDIVGVNPEVAHEQMAGLNFLHAVAQAWEAGKLFHIDLNDQVPGRYDQDFRFGSANVKAAFWLVKFLEDVGYEGPRHFDAHAYRTEDECGVKDFARGCMRTYLILRERGRQWNADKEIQGLLSQARAADGDGRPAADVPALSSYSAQHRDRLLGATFDRVGLAKKGLSYERLDQLTMELLLGVR